MPTPHVLDAFHGDEIDDFRALAASGVVGVIHKASQGTRAVDPTYANRRRQAKDAGLLWGAYHFGTAEDVERQVAHFLEVAGSDSDTLLVLDWEPNGRGGTMSVAQAERFVSLVRARTGRWPVLYTGSLAKERLPAGGSPILSNCRLWLSQYGPRAKCPPGWSEAWLWQFTGDGEGMGPHEIPGVRTRNIDLSQAARPEALASEWAGTVGSTAKTVASDAHDGAVESGIPPPPVVERPARKSWSLRLMLGAKVPAFGAWLDHQFHWVESLCGALPDIKSDVDAQLDFAKSMLGLFGEGVQHVATPNVWLALTLLLLAAAAYRQCIPRAKVPAPAAAAGA